MFYLFSLPRQKKPNPQRVWKRERGGKLTHTPAWHQYQHNKVSTEILDEGSIGSHGNFEPTFVTLRTVVLTGWPLLAMDCNAPSWYTEEREISFPVESSKPTATGMNIGSLTGCPGVGGTSWLIMSTFQQSYLSIPPNKKRKNNKSTANYIAFIYLNFKEKVRASAL